MLCRGYFFPQPLLCKVNHLQAVADVVSFETEVRPHDKQSLLSMTARWERRPSYKLKPLIKTTPRLKTKHVSPVACTYTARRSELYTSDVSNAEDAYLKQ